MVLDAVGHSAAAIVALYIASEKQKTDFHNNLVETELERSATERNGYFETVKSVAVSLSLDKEVITAFSKRLLNPMELQELSIKLKQYKRMNSCIEEIYLYHPDSSIVYSDAGIYTELEKFPFPNTREYIRRPPEMKQKYAVFADSASEIGQGGNAIRISWCVKENTNDLIFIDLNCDALNIGSQPVPQHDSGQDWNLQFIFSRIFKDKVGVSLSDMINETKLKIAAEQLRNTNKSIKEIIEGVDIVNQSYFTVMFKKKFGILPTEYRNRRQDKTETDTKSDYQNE